MRRITGAILLALAPMAQAIEYREELAPPNVDFYLELLGARTDFGNVGGDQESGLRIRLGFDLKDATVGRWMLRAEAGLNQFGESRNQTTRFDPGRPELSNDQLIIDEATEVRLSGIEAGVRLYDSELFFLRGGIFLYSLKTRYQETQTAALLDGTPNGPPNPLSPVQESVSGVGPYLGAGLEFPLVESLKAVAEYNAYRVESEYLNNISLGFRFEF